MNTAAVMRCAIALLPCVVLTAQSACSTSIVGAGTLGPVFRHPARSGRLGDGQVSPVLGATLTPDISASYAFSGALELFVVDQWSVGLELSKYSRSGGQALFVRRHFELHPTFFLAAQVGAQMFRGSFAEQIELEDGPYVDWKQTMRGLAGDIGGVATFRPWPALALSVGYGMQLVQVSGSRTCYSSDGSSESLALEASCMAEGDFATPSDRTLHSITASLRLGQPHVGAEFHYLLWLNPTFSRFVDGPLPAMPGAGVYVAW